MLAERHRNGMDRFDEWWEGTYRLVDVPPPEWGEVTVKLGSYLDGLAFARGLDVAAPVNIGLDGWDARVPKIGVYWPDTPRTSPAFLTTAVLVVEILSPGERAGERLPFYAAWGVEEYLEVELGRRSLRLLVRDGDRWKPADASMSLGFLLGDLAIDWL